MNEKKNIRLILEYDGTSYHGWQRQKNGTSVQEVLENNLRIILEEPVTVIGSGRTDAGVHALQQVCNFKTASNLSPEALKRAMNSLLRDDIFIQSAEYMPDEFHSRYSARSKRYEYRLWNRREKNIFLRHYTWHVRERLDLERISKCLSILLGRHDFSSFRSTGSSNLNPVREMTKAEVSVNVEGLVTFVFEADGFLRHMVRNIVGTVVDVGRHRTGIDEFQEILKSLDRKKAGIKAPPQGLFLTMVNY
jgi:tRNA pseudouridine38-40 synthase